MNRVGNRRVVVVGQGYVGLPLAVQLATSNWEVTGVDIEETRVLRLNQGISHIEDVSTNRLKEVITKGKYRATQDFESVRSAGTVIICVPTPLDSSRKPDLSFLDQAVHEIGRFIEPETLLVNESTSFPGTVRNHITSMLEEVSPGITNQIFLAAAPERIDPGNAQYSIVNTPRLIGGLTNQATIRAEDFYKSICNSVITVKSPEVAEMAKLLENTFRQVNIALVNQLVPMCERLGISTYDVIGAAATKPYGFMSFYPGAGVGGHCIPIDPLYLLWEAHRMNLDLPFISSADEVNSRMPEYVVRRIVELANLKRGDSCLILGISYKAGVADTRESPAYKVAECLEELGIELLHYDPQVTDFVFGSRWDLNQQVDSVIILTPHEGYPISHLVNSTSAILDCTGRYHEVRGVSSL